MFHVPFSPVPPELVPLTRSLTAIVLLVPSAMSRIFIFGSQTLLEYSTLWSHCDQSPSSRTHSFLSERFHNYTQEMMPKPTLNRCSNWLKWWKTEAGRSLRFSALSTFSAFEWRHPATTLTSSVAAYRKQSCWQFQ